jgi:hypothetical protein
LPPPAYRGRGAAALQWRLHGENIMNRWIALLSLAAALAGCAHAPAPPTAQTAWNDAAWNDGIWNSVLGYLGPASAMVDGGP